MKLSNRERGRRRGQGGHSPAAILATFVGLIFVVYTTGLAGKHVVLKTTEVATGYYHQRKLRKTIVNPHKVDYLVDGTLACFGYGRKPSANGKDWENGSSLECMSEIVSPLLGIDSEFIKHWIPTSSVAKAFNPNDIMPRGQAAKIAAEVTNLAKAKSKRKDKKNLPNPKEPVTQEEFLNAAMKWFDDNQGRIWNWDKANDAKPEPLTDEQKEIAADIRFALDEFLLIADLGGELLPPYHKKRLRNKSGTKSKASKSQIFG